MCHIICWSHSTFRDTPHLILLLATLTWFRHLLLFHFSPLLSIFLKVCLSNFSSLHTHINTRTQADSWKQCWSSTIKCSHVQHGENWNGSKTEVSGQHYVFWSSSLPLFFSYSLFHTHTHTHTHTHSTSFFLSISHPDTKILHSSFHCNF